MDLVSYDPALPELPLLNALRLGPGDGPAAPRIDWAAYVIRLAQAMASPRGGPREG
jgi:hypothetical protein